MGAFSENENELLEEEIENNLELKALLYRYLENTEMTKHTNEGLKDLRNEKKVTK